MSGHKKAYYSLWREGTAEIDLKKKEKSNSLSVYVYSVYIYIYIFFFFFLLELSGTPRLYHTSGQAIPTAMPNTCTWQDFWRKLFIVIA